MKTVLVIFAGLLLSSSAGWLTDFEQAKKQAAATQRNILLNFSGSDWCVPCIRLKKEVFETALFRAFADSNLILLQADFPRSNKNKLDPQQLKHNEALAELYNPMGKFPLTVLLDSSGSVLKKWEELNGSASALIEQIRSLTARRP